MKTRVVLAAANAAPPLSHAIIAVIIIVATWIIAVKMYLVKFLTSRCSYVNN
jgi:hypothetical protein